MTVPPFADLEAFSVIDSQGRTVGLVTAPMYGTDPDEPDAFEVRSGAFGRRHYIVPNAAVAGVDGAARRIALSVSRRRLTRFL